MDSEVNKSCTLVYARRRVRLVLLDMMMTRASIAALDHPPGSRPTGRPAERRSAPRGAPTRSMHAHAHQVTNFDMHATYTHARTALRPLPFLYNRKARHNNGAPRGAHRARDRGDAGPGGLGGCGKNPCALPPLRQEGPHAVVRRPQEQGRLQEQGQGRVKKPYYPTKTPYPTYQKTPYPTKTPHPTKTPYHRRVKTPYKHHG